MSSSIVTSPSPHHSELARERYAPGCLHVMEMPAAGSTDDETRVICWLPDVANPPQLRLVGDKPLWSRGLRVSGCGGLTQAQAARTVAVEPVFDPTGNLWLHQIRVHVEIDRRVVQRDSIWLRRARRPARTSPAPDRAGPGGRFKLRLASWRNPRTPQGLLQEFGRKRLRFGGVSLFNAALGIG